MQHTNVHYDYVRMYSKQVHFWLHKVHVYVQGVSIGGVLNTS